MSLRRMRSGGMHADSELDFLNKIKRQDTQQKRKTYCEEATHYDGFIVNSQFTFEQMEPPTMIQQSQQTHFVFVMIDDLELSPKRLQNILENTDNCETLTQSTNDDSNIWSAQVMKYDCIVHNYVLGQVTHQFNIWITNTSCIGNVFKQCYYPLFEALICINSRGSSLFKTVFDEMRHLNQKVQQYFIEENDEVSPDRRQNINFQSILKALIDSKALMTKA